MGRSPDQPNSDLVQKCGHEREKSFTRSPVILAQTKVGVMLSGGAHRDVLLKGASLAFRVIEVSNKTNEGGQPSPPIGSIPLSYFADGAHAGLRYPETAIRITFNQPKHYRGR